MNTKVKGPVSKIMTKNVITIDINADLSDACRLFLDNKIRHLPVVKNDNIVGVLSYNDVLRLSFGESYDDKSDIDDTIYKLLQIEQIMVAEPVIIHENCSIKKATKILINNKFHALPVILKHKVVGMISTTDLLKYCLKIEI